MTNDIIEIAKQSGARQGVLTKSLEGVEDTFTFNYDQLTKFAGLIQAMAVPDGYVVVPVEPTIEHLNSMGMRSRHDFGLLDEQQQESIRRSMRQLHEEAIGQGFYKIAAAQKGSV
jgi:hypothetical protein